MAFKKSLEKFLLAGGVDANQAKMLLETLGDISDDVFTPEIKKLFDGAMTREMALQDDSVKRQIKTGTLAKVDGLLSELTKTYYDEKTANDLLKIDGIENKFNRLLELESSRKQKTASEQNDSLQAKQDSELQRANWEKKIEQLQRELKDYETKNNTLAENYRNLEYQNVFQSAISGLEFSQNVKRPFAQAKVLIDEELKDKGLSLKIENGKMFLLDGKGDIYTNNGRDAVDTALFIRNILDEGNLLRKSEVVNTNIDQGPMPVDNRTSLQKQNIFM